MNITRNIFDNERYLFINKIRLQFKHIFKKYIFTDVLNDAIQEFQL